jgi:uncharacterized protein (TIGR04255 family)
VSNVTDSTRLPDDDAVADLITFQAPPVNEVVLSVQFDGPVVDDAFALAEFWPAIRPEFPKFEKHPPIGPAREDFDVPPAPQSIEFQMMTGAPGQRYWFLSAEETRLVQLQADRFVLNWRQVNTSETYPRYRELRSDFQRLFDGFMAALGSERQAQAAPALCELTYVNHIAARAEDRPNQHRHLGTILNTVRPDFRSVVGVPEDMQFAERFRLAGPSASPSDAPIGRMYVTAVPAYRQIDAAPIYVVTLLARGRPAGGSIADVLQFFDNSRNLIVREFANMTTDEMHREWQMEDHGDS